MLSAYEICASAIKTVIDNEFAPENIVAIHDNLHESLGWNGIRVGIAPIRDTQNPRNKLVQETWIEVKFYDLWTREITPETVVNPFRIANFAERFRRAIQAATASYAGSDELWFFDVGTIEYPNDPNGNKSRFVAQIRAVGRNSGLVETQA